MRALKGTSAAALSQYTQINVHTAVHTASPHRLIEMLLDGALSRIAAAEGHMQRGEIAGKGESIGWAVTIIQGLRGSLNLKAGGTLAENLDQLYDYMCRRLLVANLDNDAGVLREVQQLLMQVRSGWNGIRDQVEGNAPAHAAQARTSP